MVNVRKSSDDDLPSMAPATTPQARENQLISLSYDAAEKQIRSGNATSQLLTHFLKLGSSREALEKAKLEHETKLLEGKREQMAAEGRIEELYNKALQAMSSYSGRNTDDDYET